MHPSLKAKRHTRQVQRREAKRRKEMKRRQRGKQTPPKSSWSQRPQGISAMPGQFSLLGSLLAVNGFLYRRR